MRQSVLLMCAVFILGGCGGGGSSANSAETSSNSLVSSSSGTNQVAVLDPALVTTGGKSVITTTTRPLVIGHRGAPDVAPENTLASYRAAIAKQADYGETDVAETSDGQLVLMHDATLSRTTNVQEVFPGRASYNVSAFTLSEIRQLDAGKWFSPVFTGEKVPTLAELLALLHENKTGLFLELKSTEADLASKVAAQLVASGWVKNGAVTEKLVIISFYADHLRKMHVLVPAAQSAILVNGALSEAQIADMATFTNGIDIYFPLMNASLLALCTKYKLAPSVWTVDNPADIDSMLALPLGGITTNNLSYLRSRLPL